MKQLKLLNIIEKHIMFLLQKEILIKIKAIIIEALVTKINILLIILKIKINILEEEVIQNIIKKISYHLHTLIIEIITLLI